MNYVSNKISLPLPKPREPNPKRDQTNIEKQKERSQFKQCENNIQLKFFKKI